MSKGRFQGMFFLLSLSVYIVFLTIFFGIFKDTVPKSDFSLRTEISNKINGYSPNMTSEKEYLGYIFVHNKVKDGENFYYVFEKVEGGMNLVQLVDENFESEWNFVKEQFKDLEEDMLRQEFRMSLLQNSAILPLNYSLRFPDSIDNVPIISLGLDDMHGLNVTSSSIVELAHLPKNLQRIGSNAFSHTLFRGNIELPEGLKIIGDSAFEYSEFSGTLVLPESLEHIGSRAFSKSMFSEIKGSDNVNIEKDAFQAPRSEQEHLQEPEVPVVKKEK